MTKMGDGHKELNMVPRHGSITGGGRLLNVKMVVITSGMTLGRLIKSQALAFSSLLWIQ